MSRTKHSSKAPGFEHWSRRPGLKMATPSRYAKQLTHRLERRHAQRELARQLGEDHAEIGGPRKDATLLDGEAAVSVSRTRAVAVRFDT